VIAEDGSLSGMTIVNPGQGYPYTPQAEIGSPPQCLPATPVLDTTLNPGFNGNPNIPNGFTGFDDGFTAIQQTLPPPDSASDTVDEAIESVTRNNCECWNI
jgi:hypothetical protein